MWLNTNIGEERNWTHKQQRRRSHIPMVNSEHWHVRESAPKPIHAHITKWCVVRVKRHCSSISSSFSAWFGSSSSRPYLPPSFFLLVPFLWIQANMKKKKRAQKRQSNPHRIAHMHKVKWKIIRNEWRWQDVKAKVNKQNWSSPFPPYGAHLTETIKSQSKDANVPMI